MRPEATPTHRVTLRKLVDELLCEIVSSRENENVEGLKIDAGIQHKYHRLHGSGTPKGYGSFTLSQLKILLAKIASQERRSYYLDLFWQARASREVALSGRVPSFFHMDLHKPTKGYGWIHNVIGLSEECGITFEPPNLSNINRQLDLLVHRTRSIRGDIAALDAAYSLLRVLDRYGCRGSNRDRAHVRLMLLYHIIDFAAQIGAHRHLAFLGTEVKGMEGSVSAGSDVDAILKRMSFYCRVQIKCVAPRRRRTSTFLQGLREDADEAVNAFDAHNVSETQVHHLTPLVAGWAGAHFQRVAANISSGPTRAQFDRILDQHDEVAGTLSAKYPLQFAFTLFGESRRTETYVDPYVAEILALRMLLKIDDDDDFVRGANGLYPLDARLSVAEDILDQGLNSPWFNDKTHDAIKAEMLTWKMVIILSRYFKTRSPQDRTLYTETKESAQQFMEPLGMMEKLRIIEQHQEINAGYAI